MTDTTRDAPYADRRDAGRILAESLGHLAQAEELLVLALPRGGVPVADEVARALGARLDVLVVRKVGIPGQPEVAMGAIAAAGDSVETVENESVLGPLGGSGRRGDVFADVAEVERVELRRRQEAYRPGRPPLRLSGATVILVDDGLATGSTMRAAALAARREGPRRLVIAVPVALSDTVGQLRPFADEIVCPWTPGRFHAVGQAYEAFDQTTDDEVARILDHDR